MFQLSSRIIARLSSIKRAVPGEIASHPSLVGSAPIGSLVAGVPLMLFVYRADTPMDQCVDQKRDISKSTLGTNQPGFQGKTCEEYRICFLFASPNRNTSPNGTDKVPLHKAL